MNKELELRVNKLPQWAQRYISKLEHNNAALITERGKITDGNARITFTVNYEDVYSIPDRAKVSFQLNNDCIELSFSPEPDGNAVCIRSTVSRLTIEPVASNVINLSTRR